MLRVQLVLGGFVLIVLASPVHMFIRVGLAMLLIAALVLVKKSPTDCGKEEHHPGEDRHHGVAARVWDLLYGIVIIGGAPIVGLLLVDFGLLSLLDMICPERYSRTPMPLVDVLTGVVACGVAVVMFISAMKWRLRRRVLPAAFIVAELILGLIFGGGFFIVWMFATAMLAPP